MQISIPFTSPVTMGIFGCTLSGKTTWCKKLLEQSQIAFTKPVESILYCYGMYQPMFDAMEINIPNFKLHAGLPTKETIEEHANNHNHVLVVLDDLQHEMSKDPFIEKLFTQFAHHLNTSVIFMGNNLYHKNFSRTITINLHVIVLFRNARDAQQVKCLGRQIFPTKSVEFYNAYCDATSKEYGYIVIDLSPAGYDLLKLRSNIFQSEDPVIWKL